jgi:hypothetical protein
MRPGKDTIAGTLARDGEYLADMVDRLGWERTKDYYAEARRVLQCLGVGAREMLGP